MKRSHYLIAVLVFIVYMLATSAMALAGELGTTPYTPFNAFVDNTLQPLILSLLGTVLTVAIAYLSTLLKKKFGIEISEATANRIRGIAWDAVHIVEERAAQSLKESGTKLISANKHSEAVNYILAKVPTLSAAEADALVQSAVAKVKGMGASAEVGK